jgi:two-component system nitrate/nitrite response regulator NarL
MKKIKVFIVDDHQMLIDGIKALLIDEAAFEISGESTKALMALELIRKNVPDIVISDIHMPDLSGIEFTRQLKAAFPEVKVLALSMFGTREMISDMLEAGVSGYVLKNTGKQELIAALTRISAGEVFFSDEVSAEMMRAMHERSLKKPGEAVIQLSERELDVVRLIAKEYSNAQIAKALFISERTVETHRKNIFRKTGTKSLVGLVRYAISNKLTD